MPRGIPGSGAKGKPRIRQDTVKHHVRDLCLDIQRRICTEYDSQTIVKCIEPKDRFNLILPRRLIAYINPEVEYQQGEINYEILEQDEDEYQQSIAEVYKKYDAVLIRDKKNDL
jgi:hypothetical protein